MLSPRLTFRILAASLLGLLVAHSLQAQGPVRQSSMVAVKVDQEDCSVFNGVLRIGDIAEVEAENNFLAQRVRALDLEVLTMEQPRAVINRQQIEYRLLLAGVKPEQIALTGFERVTVELQDARQIIELLAQTVAQQCERKFRTPPGFCQVSLQPDARKLIEASRLNWRNLSVNAVLPVELKAGEQLLPVEFYSGAMVTTLQLPVHFRFQRSSDGGPAHQTIQGGASTGPTSPAERLASPIPSTSVFAQYPTVQTGSVTAVQLPNPTAVESGLSEGAASTTGTKPSVFDPVVRSVHYEVAETAGSEVLRMARPVEAPQPKPEILVARGAVVRVSQRVGQVSIGLKTSRAAQEGRLGDVIEVIAPYKGRDGREIRLLGRVIAENELELVR